MPEGIGNIGQWIGMNSGVDPESLPTNVLWQAMNTISRGGVIRTRPGYGSIYNAPSGWPQGCTFFTTSDKKYYFVFAVNGYVYASEYPFKEYFALGGIRFSPRSLHINFELCQQTTTYDEDGNFEFLAKPQNILVMQDGRTKAAYWDGTVARHLNPVKSSGEFTEVGFDETPMGLWMVWANDRLWVFRDNMGFASDIGNPLKFTETQYLSEARAFLFPGDVTGAVQPYARSPLIVFTSSTKTYLQAQIRDRTTWAETPDFQTTEYNLGCVSGKSIVKSFGETWWFSEYGVVNLDYAMQFEQSSKFQYMDNEMAVSKAYLSPTLSRVCAASYENYMLFSVPSGHIYNRHTWVLDQMNTPRGVSAWDSFWTGIRPVDWASANIDGQQRVFALSYDSDGVSRIWEAFSGQNNDNGCPILCHIETGRYNNGSKTLKKFRNSRLFLDGLVGDSYLSARVASEHGPYNEILNRKFVVTEGSIADGYTDDIVDFLPQNRRLNTEYLVIDSSGCNECSVEIGEPHDLGTAFSHQFIWLGDLGIQGFQMIMVEEPVPTDYEPDCQDDEVGPKIVTAAGTESDDRDNIPECATEYESTQEASTVCPVDENITGYAEVTRSNPISQDAADAQAACAAETEADATMYQCDDQGTGVDLPGEQDCNPTEVAGPPLGPCCPTAVVDYYYNDGSQVMRFNSDQANREMPQFCDFLTNQLTWGMCWWTQITELGTIWEWNYQIKWLGVDYWGYHRIYHDGTGWFSEMILIGDPADPFLPNQLIKEKVAIPTLPAVPDNNCYHIGIKSSHNPVQPLFSMTNQIRVNGVGYSNSTVSPLTRGLRKTGFTDSTVWRPNDARGSLIWNGRTEKGTGRISGSIGQLCIWTDPTYSGVQPIHVEDFDNIYNSCNGLAYSQFPFTAKTFAAGNLDALLYGYYDFGDLTNFPKFYNAAPLSDGQDFIEMAADEASGPEDTLVVVP